MKHFTANGPGGRMFPAQARSTRRRGNAAPTQADLEALSDKVADAAQELSPANVRKVIAQEVAATVARLETQIEQMKGAQAQQERDAKGMTVHSNDWLSDELPGDDD